MDSRQVITVEVNPVLDVESWNKIVSGLKNSLGDFGKSIKPLDDKALSAAFDNAKNSTEKLKAPLQETSKETEKLQNNFSNLGKAFAFNQSVEFLNSMKGAIEGLAKPFVALDTETQKMKTLGAEAEEMAPRLREAAIAMSKELPYGAADFQGAMGDALASGVKGGEEGLKTFAQTAAKLATGGGAELGAVVKGLGATLNAFGAGSEQAGKYADYMFNIVNYGVTTIDELNQYLSGVTPTAAAAGVEFEAVGGALALMTQKGIPASQATTKLNAMLLELQKPTAGLIPVMKAAGVSLETLKNDDLPVTLAKIQKGLTATGKSAIEAFGSSEASAGFNALMQNAGEFQKSFEDVANTSGSTDNAFKHMSQSIEVQSKQMKASFEAFSIQALQSFGSVGSGAVAATQILGEVQGPIMALAGVKSILPAGGLSAFKDMAVGAKQLAMTIIGSVIPAFVVSDVETKALVLNKEAMNIATIKNIISEKASAASTYASAAAKNVAAAAQWVWNAAMSANPIGAVIAGVVALVAVVGLVSKAMRQSAADKLADAEANNKMLNDSLNTNVNRRKELENNEKLMSSYQKLAPVKKKDAETEAQFNDAKTKLNSKYPEFLTSQSKYAENLGVIKTRYEAGRNEIAKLNKEFNVIFKQLRENENYTATLKVDVATENLTDSLVGLNKMGSILDYLKAALFIPITLFRELYTVAMAIPEAFSRAFSGDNIIGIIKDLGGKVLGTAKETIVEPFYKFGNWVSEGLFGKSLGRNDVEKVINPLIAGIKGAKDNTALQEEAAKLRDAIKVMPDISPQQKEKLLKDAEEVIKASGEKIAQQNDAIKNDYDRLISSGKTHAEAVEYVAKANGKNKGEIEKAVTQQKKATDETNKTAAATKDWAGSLSEISKGQKEAIGEIKKTELEVLKGNKTREQADKDNAKSMEKLEKNKTEARLAQKAANNANSKYNLDELKVEDEKKKKKSGSRKETESEYEIKKKMFELENKSSDALTKKAKLDADIAIAKEGKTRSQAEVYAAEKAEINNTTEALRKQLARTQELQALANKTKDTKKKSEQLQEAQNQIDEIQNKIAEAELKGYNIDIKAKLDADKLAEEIQKAMQDDRIKAIDKDIKLGIAFESQKSELLIEDLNAEINKARTEIAKQAVNLNMGIGYDKAAEFKAKQRLKELLAKLQDETDKQTEQLDAERIKKITDVNEREKETRLAQAKKTYDDEFKAAQGNYDMQLTALNKYLQAKQDAEEAHLRATSTAYTVAKNVIDAIQATSFDFSGIDEANKQIKKSIEENKNALKITERDLEKSYLKKEISTAEYYQKLNDLRTESAAKEEELLKGTKSKWDAFVDSMNKSLAAGMEKTSKDALANVKELNKKEQALREDAANQYKATGSVMQSTTDELKKTEDDTLVQKAVAYGAYFAQQMAMHGNTMKAMRNTLLEAVKNEIPIMAAKAIITSIGNFGFPLGPIMGALAAAAIYAAASALQGLKEGSRKPIEGPGTEKSDSVVIRASKNEWMMNAEATKVNEPALLWANIHKKDLREMYFDDPELRRRIIKDVMKKDMVRFNRQAEVIRQYETQAQQDNRVLDEMKKHNETLRQELVKSRKQLVRVTKEIKRLQTNIKTRIAVEHSGSFKVNSGEMVAEIESTKQRKLSRG